MFLYNEWVFWRYSFSFLYFFCSFFVLWTWDQTNVFFKPMIHDKIERLNSFSRSRTPLCSKTVIFHSFFAFHILSGLLTALSYIKVSCRITKEKANTFIKTLRSCKVLIPTNLSLKNSQYWSLQHKISGYLHVGKQIKWLMFK